MSQSISPAYQVVFRQQDYTIEIRIREQLSPLLIARLWDELKFYLDMQFQLYRVPDMQQLADGHAGFGPARLLQHLREHLQLGSIADEAIISHEAERTARGLPNPAWSYSEPF